MVLKENLRVKQVHQGEDPMDIGYQPGNVWSVGSEVDVSCCVFAERAVKPAEISGTVRECRHAPAGNSCNADCLSSPTVHVIIFLTTTTEGGVCQMAKAKYVGRRQEAICLQAALGEMLSEITNPL
ncbi:hypothetical protein TGRH88_085600 [Toxoplasma gondii]|uniref:Uncharacterized protein n=2 Tax=Toxoplasma gondii TaxID=5811 RepID=A0A7J6KH72_TOXGO|nr:hypothetical protein TGRH88_085600 [Toxoplasma gondii]